MAPVEALVPAPVVSVGAVLGAEVLLDDELPPGDVLLLLGELLLPGDVLLLLGELGYWLLLLVGGVVLLLLGY
jgi:hypothetical protein